MKMTLPRLRPEAFSGRKAKRNRLLYGAVQIGANRAYQARSYHITERHVRRIIDDAITAHNALPLQRPIVRRTLGGGEMSDGSPLPQPPIVRRTLRWQR